MARTLRYHPLFESDVLNAAGWYDQSGHELGADFINRVHSAVEHLILGPELQPILEIGLRYWSVDRFPFVIFYKVTEYELLIVGVMHTSRDSSKWLVDRTL
ncbi:MAG: type II toxin-antitoxin system RelE/ParE family toxin [Planctomycetota bacterium]|nr:type II toxin-antitoxin system RelE/ParE family toxin [Planctomycetota bacterium]